MNKVGRIAITTPCYRRIIVRSSAAATTHQLPGPLCAQFISRNFATVAKEEPLSSSNSSTTDRKRGRRVWRAIQGTDDEWTNILNNKNDSIAYLTADGTSSAVEIKHWEMAVDDDGDDRRLVNESLSRICEQVRIYHVLFDSHGLIY